MARLLIAALMVLLVACAPEVTVTAQSVESVTGVLNSGDVISWRTLGCDEPAPLAPEFSESLETDAGLASGSLAEEYGVSGEEAMRRLRLQPIMGERMQQVRSAEGSRVARAEFQHEPYYAGIVTLTGDAPVSQRTVTLLCDTPELEVRLGANFSEAELIGEVTRLAPLVRGEFGDEVPSMGPGEGELFFDTRTDEIKDALDDFLATETTYPYTIYSIGLPPLVLDGTVPFPLLDTTGMIQIDVGFSGVLTIEGPCPYLGDRLLILPARETTWDAATGALSTGIGTVYSGETVSGGGGEYRQPLDELDQPPDPSCRTEAGAMLVRFNG